MVFRKLVVIDCRGHLFGRLAAVIAKELLKGQSIVCVRCEEIVISGDYFRSKLRFASFLHKCMITNPVRHFYHHRAPSRIFRRAVRGMLPHKRARGQQALGRLQVFDGVPPPYDKVKRVVVPSALRFLHLRPGRKYAVLNRLSSDFGWSAGDMIAKLEQKRKQKSTAFYRSKIATSKIRAEAAKIAGSKLADTNKILTQSGYRI